MRKDFLFISSLVVIALHSVCTDNTWEQGKRQFMQVRQTLHKKLCNDNADVPDILNIVADQAQEPLVILSSKHDVVSMASIARQKLSILKATYVLMTEVQKYAACFYINYQERILTALIPRLVPEKVPVHISRDELQAILDGVFGKQVQPNTLHLFNEDKRVVELIVFSAGILQSAALDG
jgi:hypothetical protein